MPRADVIPEIRISPNADALQRFAADELRRYLHELFNLDGTICTRSVPRSSHRFVIGTSNDKSLPGFDKLPPLSREGHLVRRVDSHTMVLAGGSSAAAAWAVYELVWQWGVRFLLHGDVFPQNVAFHLPAVDKVVEPTMSIRWWRQFNEHATGPAFWSLQQHDQFIRQLFKLKFNGIYLSIWPQQPFVQLEVDGIRRTSSAMLFGFDIPIDDETIGREHLSTFDRVIHPELGGAAAFEEQHGAGKRLMHAIITLAKRFDMRTAVAFQPLEFPVQFRPLLEKPSDRQLQLGGLTCAERGNLTNPRHLRLIRAWIDAHLEEFASVDELILSVPEHPQADDDFAPVWQDLSARRGLAHVPIDDLLNRVRNDHLTDGGVERAEREFKSTLAMLHFYDQLFASSDVLARAGSKKVTFGVALGSGALESLSFIDRVLWPGAPVHLFLDYTAQRSVRRMHHMEGLASGRVPASIILTLQDDNIGSLPQVVTDSVHVLLQQMHRLKWQGYLLRYWPIGDLDPVTAYLSRASWDATLGVRESYQDHLERAVGARGSELFSQVLGLLEEATLILDVDFISLLFPVPDTMMRYLDKDATPEALHHVRGIYRQCRTLLDLIAGTCDREDAKGYVRYWTSRVAFAIGAIDEIQSLTQAGIAYRAARLARDGDDHDAMRRALVDSELKFADAIRAGRRALQAAANNVRDDSDRWTLACYHHFLVREVEQKRARLMNDFAEIDAVRVAAPATT
jgi:hypothetical protein